MEKDRPQDDRGDVSSPLTYPEGGARKPSPFAELRERFAQLTPPDITLGSEMTDDGGARDDAYPFVSPSISVLSNGNNVESWQAEEAAESVQLRFDALLGDLDIIEEIDWEETSRATSPRSSPHKRLGGFRDRSARKWWLYNQCIPRLLDLNAQRGFISLHQLAHILDIIGDDRLLLSDLTGSLDSAGVHVTRSVANSRVLGRNGQVPIRKAEIEFADLLSQPPRPLDVLRYLGLDQEVLSQETITFVARAFELHCLTKYDEGQYLERLIAARAQRGRPDAARSFDPEAWNVLYEDNILVACRVAAKNADLGLGMDDLVQEGCTGIAHGLSHYQPKRVHRFQQYVQTWVFQSIRRALADQGKLIRVPVHFHEQVLRPLREFVDEYTATHGEQPSAWTCSTALGLSLDNSQLGLQHLVEPTSLDALSPLTTEDSWEPLTLGEPDDYISRYILTSALSTSIQELLGSLSVKEQTVIRLRYGFDSGWERTLEEVGQVIGLTRERVRQIEKEVITRLQHPTRRRKLVEFFEGA